MQDFDSDEDLDQDHPCPFCGTPNECEHQIILLPWGEGDIFGPLIDEADDLGDAITKAIWNIVCGGGSVADIAASSASGPMKAFVNDECFEEGTVDDDHDSCDWQSLLWKYWLDMAAGCGGVRHSWTFLGDTPAGSDEIDAVYAENPEKVIKATLAAVKADNKILKGLRPKKK
jgi:hypothetical protein